MLEVPESEILARMREENPWWQVGQGIDPELKDLPRRAYLANFGELVRQKDVHRAVVLMGPRRVGKTYLVKHTIHDLLEHHEVSGRDILYVMLETPICAPTQGRRYPCAGRSGDALPQVVPATCRANALHLL